MSGARKRQHGGDGADGGDKGLLNEVLPDPRQAVDDLAAGGPRSRTAEHLKRILAAAGAGLALEAACVVHSDDAATQTKPIPQTAPQGDPPPPPPPPPPEPGGYGVVDPMPMPYLEPDTRPGTLKLESTPVARIFVDGVPTGRETPRALELPTGRHTISLKAKGRTTMTFTVDIAPGETISEKRQLD
jgi:hypothetical protein